MEAQEGNQQNSTMLFMLFAFDRKKSFGGIFWTKIHKFYKNTLIWALSLEFTDGHSLSLSIWGWEGGSVLSW